MAIMHLLHDEMIENGVVIQSLAGTWNIVFKMMEDGLGIQPKLAPGE
jgi:hypothetical protein